MVDAGWCFDPSPDEEDGVTCFYCDVSLDGWEPKDDPMYEDLSVSDVSDADRPQGGTPPSLPGLLLLRPA